MHLVRFTTPCSEHGPHVCFLASLDDTAPLLADILEDWHREHGLACSCVDEEEEGTEDADDYMDAPSDSRWPYAGEVDDLPY
jgi:hypothetical protein